MAKSLFENYVCHEPPIPAGDGGDGGKGGRPAMAGNGANGGNIYFVGSSSFVLASRDFAVANFGGENGVNGSAGHSGTPGVGGKGGGVAKGCGSGNLKDGKPGIKPSPFAELSEIETEATSGKITEVELDL